MSDEIIEPEDLENLFDKSIEIADSLRLDLIDAATNAGYTRDTLARVKPYWVELSKQAIDDPSIVPIVRRGAEFIQSYHDELASLQDQTKIPLSGLYSVASTAGTLIANTNSTSSIVMVATVGEVPYVPNPLRRENGQTYMERFAKIDPALGSTYKQIWESLYATGSDPERAALFLIRQAFDHLFDRLAPDADVRASEHWKPKDGDRPEQIYRQERIEYAAYTHVKDSTRARTLAASARQMVETYQLLNHAHDRGELDRDKARKALVAMQRLLEDWADALNL